MLYAVVAEVYLPLAGFALRSMLGDDLNVRYVHHERNSLQNLPTCPRDSLAEPSLLELGSAQPGQAGTNRNSVSKWLRDLA